MEISFTKYQGTGNDFVMIDNRSLTFPKTDLALVRKLCNRKFGIGADGLILLECSDKHDFTMEYYNADGSQSFCGNGSRCALAFAKELGMIKEQAVFLSTDGVHEAKIDSTGIVHLSMHDVKGIETIGNDLFLNTGSPHYVVFVDELENYEVVKQGRAIRNNARFKANGTNVNFVQVCDTYIQVRTYERGVEDETLSCGTGVTACAIAAFEKYDFTKLPIEVRTPGGVLYVSFKQTEDGNYAAVYLSGPAQRVFTGLITFTLD